MAGSDSNRSRSTRAREFQYSHREFERVQELIHQRVGIHLADNKGEMVYSRLARRLRATGIQSMASYLDLLQRQDHPEWQNFINALTTNLTAFFRESHHFDTLQTHVRAIGRRSEPLRIWCCAASTGEEPYSIAMTVLRAAAPGQEIEILASDVDTGALETAERGVYSLERLEKLDPAMLKAYFLRGKGINAGRTRVKQAVRDRVRFTQANLLDSRWPVEYPLDAIFCRNVFIYFQQETQQALLQRFHRLLRPDGLFFAGHSESLMSSGHLFKSLGKTVFSPVSLAGTANG